MDDSLTLLTLLPKQIPALLADWPQWLLSQKISQTYNALHLLPLHPRGASDSPYSIRKQHDIDDGLFATKLSTEEKWKQVSGFVQEMKKNNVRVFADVVWNHTSFDSEWLWEHPDAAFNPHNSPHLESAALLDAAIINFSAQVPSHLRNPRTTDEIDSLIANFNDTSLAALKLWEFFVLDTAKEIERFTSTMKNTKPAIIHFVQRHPRELIPHIPQVLGTRHQRTIPVDVALAYLEPHLNKPFDEILSAWKTALEIVNLIFYEEYDRELVTILGNIKQRAIYCRVDEGGPRLGAISRELPLVEQYFTVLPRNATTAKHDPKCLSLANNGWIWNGNPLVDFATSHSRAYLRREVIVWGDCVKLRYGESEASNPYLWKYISDYTCLLAKHFQGLRVDNCHSTPKHVAAYMLKQARKIRPDLYIFAELFTGSEELDKVFVKELGINALIREALQAGHVPELSRYVWMYSGSPVGSLNPNIIKELPSLLVDCTHDNETPTQKRTPEDTLSNAAIVAFASCAVGSVWGYDYVNPKIIDCVQEKRKYDFIANGAGIIQAKTLLMKLHEKMAKEHYSEIHIHQENEFITIHRQNPTTHQGYLLVARTAFKQRQNPISKAKIDSSCPAIICFLFAPIKLRKCFAVEMAARLTVKMNEYQKSSTVINGLPSQLEMSTGDLLPNMVEIESTDEANFIRMLDFPPGAVLVLKTWMSDPCVAALANLQTLLADANTLRKHISSLGFAELNIALYRSDAEERDVFVTEGQGTYNVPNFGDLSFCGIQGFMTPLKKIILNNELHHPLCAHLRDGTWLLDYTVRRVERYSAQYPALKSYARWLFAAFQAVKVLPDFLIPKYFVQVITLVHSELRLKSMATMPDFIKNGSEFVQDLAMGSIQMLGPVNSTSLIPLKQRPALAAGLPHFSVQYMRCWGRDVFLSLKGLFLLTGRFEEAKEHIIAFASVVRHGLIPNLLDAGRSPRYNCRDAVWFWMKNLFDYCDMAPDGYKILDEIVALRFPNDTFCEWDSKEAFSRLLPLRDIVFDIMQRHADGIHFREHNAGSRLDHAMKEEGFQIDVQVDWSNGFVQGGNLWNCGTWMDKMGDSDRAGSKGTPSTPRDGADIEIIGFLKACLRSIATLHRTNRFSWPGVQIGAAGARTVVTWDAWNKLLLDNFESYFWIPERVEDDGIHIKC